MLGKRRKQWPTIKLTFTCNKCKKSRIEPPKPMSYIHTLSILLGLRMTRKDKPIHAVLLLSVSKVATVH